MSDLLALIGLFLLALGFSLGGTAGRACHIAAAVVLGVAALTSAVGAF